MIFHTAVLVKEVSMIQRGFAECGVYISKYGVYGIWNIGCAVSCFQYWRLQMGKPFYWEPMQMKYSHITIKLNPTITFEMITGSLAVLLHPVLQEEMDNLV